MGKGVLGTDNILIKGRNTKRVGKLETLQPSSTAAVWSTWAAMSWASSGKQHQARSSRASNFMLRGDV